MRLSAILGVVAALVCAGRSDLGFGIVLPAFGACLLFIGGDAVWHATRPASRAVMR